MIPLDGPDRSLWGEFAASALRLQGLILALLGIIASIIVWWVAPDFQIRIAWLWIALLGAAVIIWLLVDVARQLHGRPVRFLPKVVTAIESNGLTERPILILEKSDLFGHGSLVTMFHRNEAGIELQTGSGYVLTIQTDRQIQVEITHWAKAHIAVLDNIKAGSKDTLARLLVKPSVTQASVQGLPFEAIGIPDESNETEVADDAE